MKNLRLLKIICFSVVFCLFATSSALINVVSAEDSFGDPFEGSELQNPNWKWQNEPSTWDIGDTREGFLTINSEPNRNVWASDDSHFNVEPGGKATTTWGAVKTRY